MTRSISSIANLRLWSEQSVYSSAHGPRHALRIICPALGRNSRRPTITGTRATPMLARPATDSCGFSERRGILGRHANRVSPSWATPVSMTRKPASSPTRPSASLQQGGLEGSTVPNAGSDEMMKLIVADLAGARRHRLERSCGPRTNQPRYRVGTSAPRLVPERRDKRRKPAIEIGLPVQSIDRPSISRPLMNHQPALGIQKRAKR